MFKLRSLRSWKGPLALAGVGAVGFALGALNFKPTAAVAQTPAGPVIPAAGTTSDYSQRVVAYIHGNVPITREDLGEYLIARYAPSKVELLVNRRIIELAAKQRNVTVSDAEIEAIINDEIRPWNADRALFTREILKPRGMTMFEYKEDVIRHALLLKKMCEVDVKVEEEELKKLFESKYGEKVRCRLIMWKADEMRIATKVWEKIRNSEAEFDREASQQADARLASVGGRIDPIGRGVANNDLIEKIAFRLKPGEISELFPVDKLGIAVLKCEGRVPAPPGVTLDQRREELHKIVFEQKVMAAVKEKFLKLREEAKPQILIPHGASNVSAVRNADDEKRIMKEEKPLAPLPNQPQKPTK